jgi:hypothetical protein
MSIAIRAGVPTLKAINPSWPTLPANGRFHYQRDMRDWVKRIGRAGGSAGIELYRLPPTNGGDSWVVEDVGISVPDPTAVISNYGLEQSFLGFGGTNGNVPIFQSLRPLNRVWGWRIVATDGVTVLADWQWQTPRAGATKWSPAANTANSYLVEVAWQQEVMASPTLFSRFRWSIGVSSGTGSVWDGGASIWDGGNSVWDAPT